MTRHQIDVEDFRRIATETFGAPDQWRFRCPQCGHVQSIASVKEHDTEPNRDNFTWITFSCEGRFVPGFGCNWTLGGLFKIHTVEVRWAGQMIPSFEFDDDEANAAVAEASKSFVAFEHPATDIEKWSEFEWEDWIPEGVRTLIQDFWKEGIGRGPHTWMAGSIQQGSPGIGARVVMQGYDKEDVSGRYVHCWNNIGRVVRDDGTYAFVSF